MTKTEFDRRGFLKGVTASAAVLGGSGLGLADEPAGTPQRGIRVRFLGSGAAGWKPAWGKKNPHARRQSSVLIENKVLIDFTMCSFDHLPDGCRPEVLFQTHSHGDHYSPEAIVKSGVKRLYVHESWTDSAKKGVAAAAKKFNLPSPEITGISFGSPVEACGLTITAVPANHSTSRVTNGVLERTALYLVEKGPSRLLYATDTGGIPGDAARMIGIDYHVRENSYGLYGGDKNPFVRKPAAITAFIMEATDGDTDDDFRLFVHSSVQCVARTVSMLKATKRFMPPEGQSAYITHLGLKYREWPAEKINAELPEGLKAAADGMELVLG